MADAYNLGRDAIDELRSLLREFRSVGGVKSLLSRFNQSPAPSYLPPPAPLLAQNKTDEEIPAYSYVRPKTPGAAFSSADYRVHVLPVEKPSTTLSPIYYATGARPLAPVGQPGDIGPVQVGPIVRLACEGSTPSVLDHLGPQPDSWLANKHYPAASVCLGVLDDEKKIVLATLSPITCGIGKANGTIANRASGAFSVWAGTLGSEVEITGMDPTGFNLGPEVVSGDWIEWAYVGGQLAFVKLCD